MHRVVHWLIPAPSFREEIEREINELAREHGAPVFTPHVTLGAINADDGARLESVADILAGTPALTLEIAGVKTGRSFSHCLFVEFTASEPLSRLMAVFSQTTGVEPHLSLLYCPPERRGSDVVNRVSLPFDCIAFDQVWQVPMSGSVTGMEDVAAWRPGGRIPLRPNRHEQ